MYIDYVILEFMKTHIAGVSKNEIIEHCRTKHFRLPLWANKFKATKQFTETKDLNFNAKVIEHLIDNNLLEKPSSDEEFYRISPKGAARFIELDEQRRYMQRQTVHRFINTGIAFVALIISIIALHR